MRGKLKKQEKLTEDTVFTNEDGKVLTVSEIFPNGKRYNTVDSYFKKLFNKKVVKIAVDIGATCPNLDGTKSTKGCTYCANGSGDFASSGDPVESFNKGVELVSKKWNDALYMVYFQSYSNTYMSVERLKENVDKVINLDKVVGISIATRPDCISNKMLDYLEKLSHETFLIIELGLQSTNDNTLKLINRGHTFKEFEDTFNKLKSRGIKVCVHIINGLINETKEDMINTCKTLNLLNPNFIKIHLLYFIENTIDTLRLQNGDIKPLTKEEYVDIVVSELEVLNPNIIIERLTGDGDKLKIVAPLYSLDKKGMLSKIDKTLKERNTYQGRLSVSNNTIM